MQGLADGYFVIPYTLGNYIASNDLDSVSVDSSDFATAETEATARIQKLLSIQGTKTVTEYHRELGQIMWDYVGMSRTAEGLKKAIEEIKALREDFWKNVLVPGENSNFNKNLEFAGRVADFLELGELMARDALERKESCGGHFREEYQSPEGEAQRNDDLFTYVAAWAYKEGGHELMKEPLEYENVKLTTRSYK